METNARGTRGGRTIEVVSTPYKNFLDFIPSRRGSFRQSYAESEFQIDEARERARAVPRTAVS